MKCFIKQIKLLLLIGLLSNTVAGAAELELEMFTYRQDFETGELSAWASYPLWQDTAYDPNFRIGTIVPGDPNISVIQKVTPYTNVDNYAGAQKKFDMYMTPGSMITLRYYLKTNLPVGFFKVRLASGPDGIADYTIASPATNRWEWITVDYNDLLQENPHLAGKSELKVNALAVLAKIPDADPSMPVFLGLDDVTFKGARAVHFTFTEPAMHKLSEWKPYIPGRHYSKGDVFNIEGQWNLDAERVTITVTSFTDRSKEVYGTGLKQSGKGWSAAFKLSFPEGLYHAALKAENEGNELSTTEFTIYIAPKNIGGRHPRVWFDAAEKIYIVDRLKSERFKKVADNILSRAESAREDNPVDSIVFEVDQFHTLLHKGNSLPSIYPWFTRINAWRSGVYNSALAYTLLDDREAGEYGKNLMVKLSTFPYWLHPWFFERGRHIYYPIGELGMEMSIAYDLLYDIMDENERKMVRDAMMKNIVIACHKGYVEDDLVTNNTSNWVAHITGGSLMCQAAMYGDDPGLGNLEPYFTGAVMKNHDLIQKTFDRDGAYGEGYGYYNFSMLSWSKTLPAMENVFNIDMSGKIHRSYNEIVWAGIIKDKSTFCFGDSGGNLRPLTNWAWLLPKYKDPLLGWLYNFMKSGETFMDVLYETDDVPRREPFEENPVRFFRDVGTTVFKSGWESDDFVFVMRTGAFYNHQHLDQGSFWLSDRGSLFIEERHGSTYYEDPLYQSWYTQPVAHSTILIDNNHQSQRVGDPLEMAEGFHDHASLCHYLDGEYAAFSSGDIGKLYWGKVKDMKRNVLYLKPRTILMLDTVTPADTDIDASLLFQTTHLKDITAGNTISMIIKDSNERIIENPNKYRGEVSRTVSIPTDKSTLFIRHLYPENLDVKSVETPHYLNTLKNRKPLEREGMLTVTARTEGKPLVIANLLMSGVGEIPDIVTEKGNGYIAGNVDGADFIFTTQPDHVYQAGDIQTDALALTRKEDSRIFASLCTVLKQDDRILIESEEPVTCEIGAQRIRYYLANESHVSLGVTSKPSSITLNKKAVKNFTYKAESGTAAVTLPAGEGIIEITY